MMAMANLPTKSPNTLRIKVRLKNGSFIPDEPLTLPTDQTYFVIVELNPVEEVNALAEIAAMAQPIGPADLSVNFDSYTRRVLNDDTTL